MTENRNRGVQSNNNKLQYGSTRSENDVETQDPKSIKYPKSVFFIISNEFCERFSFYGMRTILSIYLQNKLNYSETNATLIYHFFVMLCYFFPAFGAIIADSFLGKYKTIFYLSIIYALGSITLSVTSTGFGFLGYSEREFTLLGLLLVAIGTGGIKPCVSSFGGDQFVLPQQEKQLQQFFSVFYFSINAGSLISTFLTPELRSESCLGQDTCYPLAFGVPAVLMVVSLIIFISGRWMYKIKKPSGNIMVDVVKCSSYAVVRKIKSSEKHEHWLDFAKNKYNKKLIDDTKIFMSIVLLFSPTVLFWALYDQQGTAWTFQATRMNGEIGSFTIKPDQMQVINPVLILLFIPLFECLIYPILAKLHLVRTALQKITVGGFLVAVAFFVAAAVEAKIQPTYEVLPQAGEAQLRIINGFNCTTQVEFDNNGPFKANIDRLGILQLKSIQAIGNKNIDVSLTINKQECPFIQSNVQFQGTIEVTESKSVSYLFSTKRDDPTKYYLSKLGYDVIKKNENGIPQLRIVYNILQNSTLDLITESDKTEKTFNLDESDHSTETITVPSEKFKMKLNGNIIANNVDIEVAGVYTFFITQIGNQYEHNLYEISPPNSVHILWQLPQIIILTAAEIMFSITGLEFSYSQAPKSMKSVMSSIWLLTDAIGNLCVVIMAEVLKTDSQVKQFIIYGVLMIIIMVVFSFLAIRYKYVTPEEDGSEDSEDQGIQQSKENPGFNLEE